MIVVFSLMRRRVDVSSEEFRRHWLDPHGPLVCRFPRLRRYSQNHVIVPGGAMPLDGFAELAYDTDADQEATTTSPAMAACDEDSPQFIGSVLRVVTTDRVILAPPSESAKAAKQISVLIGKPETTETVLTEFRNVARKTAGLIGLVENLSLRQRGPRSKVPALDVPVAAIVELWFSDEHARNRGTPNPAGTPAIHAYPVTEHRFI